jgi:hypothetical protein
MNQSSRNYHAHGGNEWVVGGKLTFLPGATVEGAEGLFDLSAGQPVRLSPIPTSNATTMVTLREDFNRLIEALKAAGLMTPDAQTLNAPDDAPTE